MTKEINNSRHCIAQILCAIILLFAAIGCKSKIYKLNISITQTTHYNKESDHIQIAEYFVISNPPNNQQKLRKLLENEFGNAVLPENNIYELNRIYYKETSKLNKNYKETSKKHETIDIYFNDIIASVDWIKSPYGKSLTIYYYSNGKVISKEIIYNSNY